MGFGSDKCAYQSAVRNYVRNLQTATRDIKEFKLGAAISEVMDNGHIKFKLGMKEGIVMDDCYLVGEWEMDVNGNVEFVESGWVRVGSIIDNRKDRIALSSAWPIKSGSWAPGMFIVEHPRLNIDVAVKTGLFQTKITGGELPDSDPILKTNDVSDFAFGADIDFHVNLAPMINLSQTFFVLGGHVSMLSSTPEFRDSNEDPTDKATNPFIFGFHGGLMKKIYMGQLALTVEAKAGIKMLSFTQPGKDTFGDDVDYNYSISSITTQLGLGLDWAATPDINVGFMGGYCIAPESDEWTIEEDDNELSYTVNEQDIKVNHSGVAIMLYIHYTPMSLPFDPVDLFGDEDSCE